MRLGVVTAAASPGGRAVQPGSIEAVSSQSSGFDDYGYAAVCFTITATEGSGWSGSRSAARRRVRCRILALSQLPSCATDIWPHFAPNRRSSPTCVGECRYRPSGSTTAFAFAAPRKAAIGMPSSHWRSRQEKYDTSPAVKISNPRHSPRSARRAVGGFRTWVELSGCRASSLLTLLLSGAFVWVKTAKIAERLDADGSKRQSHHDTITASQAPNASRPDATVSLSGLIEAIELAARRCSCANTDTGAAPTSASDPGIARTRIPCLTAIAQSLVSAGTGRAIAGSASATHLSLSSPKTCLCPLAGSLELAHTRLAGGPLSVRLGLVQVVTLAGVLSLGSEVVEMRGGHRFSLERASQWSSRLPAAHPGADDGRWHGAARRRDRGARERTATSTWKRGSSSKDSPWLQGYDVYSSRHAPALYPDLSQGRSEHEASCEIQPEPHCRPQRKRGLRTLSRWASAMGLLRPDDSPGLREGHHPPGVFVPQFEPSQLHRVS